MRRIALLAAAGALVLGLGAQPVAARSGATIVETRAPNIRHELAVGESCTVPAMTAHRVYSKDGAACRFLVLEGIGCYDSLPVGDRT